jgi:hypothetical protein
MGMWWSWAGRTNTMSWPNWIEAGVYQGLRTLRMNCRALLHSNIARRDSARVDLMVLLSM